MKRIGVLSDTHSYIYPGIFKFFDACDELWHAGDIGNAETYHSLKQFKPLRAVYGNIDGHDVRILCPEIQLFKCEDIKVMMKHIGGYPGRYDPSIRHAIPFENPDIFISGHSHILKVINDKKNSLLHINPGAAGKNGLHKMITCVRFIVDGKNIRDLEILEKSRL
jgi:putative phosphoesterase